VVLHTAGSPNPANAPRGEACGHEKNETHEANETGDHDGPDARNDAHGHEGTWEHNETAEHDFLSGHEDNAVCDREDGDADDHPGNGHAEPNETKDED